MNAKKTIKFLSLKHQQDFIKKEVENAFNDTFDKSHYILGPGLQNFEKKFATYCE